MNPELDLPALEAVVAYDARVARDFSHHAAVAYLRDSINGQPDGVSRSWMRDLWRSRGWDTGETVDDVARRLEPLASRAAQHDPEAEFALAAELDALAPAVRDRLHRVLPGIDGVLGAPCSA